ncbi:MAG TPA: LuxR C-terminal-related transcriptional regulator [Flavisolibacter sp.]
MKLQEDNSKELANKIRRGIEEIKAIENQIPSVIIIHDIRDSTVVYMSERGRRQLGVDLDELREMGQNYYARFFNPEDAKDYVPKIFGLLERNNNDEIVSFFQQVRTSQNNDWTWYLSSTKIFIRDENDKPILTITNAIPIDNEHYFTSKIERLLQENNFLRSNKHVFASLTGREKNVLTLMALGHNSAEIAGQLHISENTAATHRRNIKKKLKAQSNYEITLFAQAFDLI